jgi:amino acid transporter
MSLPSDSSLSSTPAEFPAGGDNDPSADRPEAVTVHEVFAEHEVPVDEPSVTDKVKTLLVGKPFDLADKRVYHHLSLVAFLAWVGLGADGLSSSCYGPSEAFEHLKEHSYLAIFLALATMFTVVVISACYSHIIEAFPSGGGGYLVASKMLGPRVGALAGCALIVDYVLTVTVSIAAAGDALFGLLGLPGGELKVWAQSGAIAALIVLNLRGVKESINVLMPIFITFLATHAVLIFGALGMHVSEFGQLTHDVSQHMAADVRNPEIGWLVVIGMFLKAYSLGAGTYTGIEAVSNSMAVMREPRVATAQRTMLYMAISLAVTAGGLMVAYLLFELDLKKEGTSLIQQRDISGRTLNDLLAGWFAMGAFPTPVAQVFRWITVLSEATLLLVAAQAGFIGGPKCLANMAHDSWVPHWFGSLSERLASHYGITLIGLASIVALWANSGPEFVNAARAQAAAAAAAEHGAESHVIVRHQTAVSSLVVMYSINVFVTFSLSMIGMTMLWYRNRTNPARRKRLTLFAFGAVLCIAILVVTISFKFTEGAWKTVLVTGTVTGVALLIHRYYDDVRARLRSLDESLGTIEVRGEPNLARPDPENHTAVILVGGYSGLGVHTLLNSIRFVPNHFKNMIFISVGVVDSGNFKGIEELERLRKHVESSLEKYVELARRLGFPSTSYIAMGTDVVDELEQLCRVVHRDFPKSVVFAGQLVFQRETWYGAVLHNQTAYSLQRRLQWDGVPMVILPTRVREK